ncbi:mitogen-activated protein kinase kinase kinase 19 [Myxocyprinus asiaticus]|uniref:mitogen-activated protein kinase kinase kinase 19 n=1 Tax=Myxocyprinus asiaticus TaxID=70543 RepID=UPI0022222148|nr:mitogen-activated protein kinase kinase kinase 19 [Myxocyprinus asiaticus]
MTIGVIQPCNMTIGVALRGLLYPKCICLHVCMCTDNRICCEGSMEPKIDIRQDGKDERKRSSRTSSLPSLWDCRKSWDKIRHPSLNKLTSSSKPILPVRHFTQLSKSAPMLMQPLLDASVLLQARANIYNRLRGGDTEDEDVRQKSSQPTLCTRTPKHLTPLDTRCRDGSALSSLEHPMHLKPTSILPLSSESRRNVERISRQSVRRSKGTRAGSQESNSCSSSSQEEEENVPQETHKIFGCLEKSLNLELGSHLNFQDLVSSGIITKATDRAISDDKKDDTPFRSFEVEAKMRQESSKTTENSEDLEKKSQNIDIIRTYCTSYDGPSSIAKEIHPLVRDRGSELIEVEKHLTNVDISVVDQIPLDKNKTVKSIRRKDRKGKTSFHTNQSFNILAHKNQSTVNTTRNRINSPCHSKAKLRESKTRGLVITGETTNKSYLPRMTPTPTYKNTTNEAPPTKRVSEPLQHTKLSGDDKKLSNNGENQLNRDLRSARPSKKPSLGAAQRARSAVDYVTYNDMFLKISQGDEGPAIYEMFATPVYENLRAGKSSEKTIQVHTVVEVKQINGKQRGKKTVEVNRRKHAQSERYSRTKCRQLKRRINAPKGTITHPAFAENKHPVFENSDGTFQQMKSKIPDIKGEGRETIERQCSSILSVIEEVLSNSLSNKNIPQLNNSTTRPHLIKDIKHQEPQTPTDTSATVECELSSVNRFTAQPLINTWTSDRSVSPAFQRFLNEVSDGPLTDDLLRSLAEELMSLEGRDAETLKTEKEDRRESRNNLPSEFKKRLNEGVSSGELHYTNGFCSDDAITWTKGEVLGKGAFGTVYCGLTSQGQLIAVKQVALDASSSEMAEKEYARLEREVDLLKNLHHTNIVGFLGTALCENIVSIFMEYVPGGSISSILNRFGPLPEKVFAFYTQQILEGVAYLHANRVIHRDLKGNNIMLMATGVVKLIDFGCARRLSCLTGSKSDLLKSVHGTPYWMAPEVISETGHGRKSDIWSIGCTVFEMATGKPPLAHMTKIAALFYIGARKGLMPSLSDNFSTHANGFVQACLTRDPTQRPSAEELLKHPFISHHNQVNKWPVN